MVILAAVVARKRAVSTQAGSKKSVLMKPTTAKPNLVATVPNNAKAAGAMTVKVTQMMMILYLQFLQTNPKCHYLAQRALYLQIILLIDAVREAYLQKSL
jgi:hypothetical protein